MVSAEPSATMDVLKEGIKAVAVGVGGSKPIPEHLVAPLIQVRTKAYELTRSHTTEPQSPKHRVAYRYDMSSRSRQVQ